MDIFWEELASDEFRAEEKRTANIETKTMPEERNE